MTKTFELANLRFLVVDDQPVSLALVKGILIGAGASGVVEAASVAEALARAADPGNAIQAAIIDVYMLPRNGLELVKEIRTGQTRLRADLPILLLTALSDSGVVRLAVDLDVNGFSVKPVSPPALVNRVVQVMHGAHRIKAADAYAPLQVAGTIDISKPRVA